MLARMNPHLTLATNHKAHGFYKCLSRNVEFKVLYQSISQTHDQLSSTKMDARFQQIAQYFNLQNKKGTSTYTRNDKRPYR